MTNVAKANVTAKHTRVDNRPRVTSTKIKGVDVDTSRFRYNQTPVETPNGTLKVFTLPSSDVFVSGLLELFINGNQKVKSVEWQETGTTKITLLGDLSTNPPTSDEKIRLNYIKT